MSIAIIAPHRDVTEWVELIKSLDPDIQTEVYPEIKDKNRVELVIVWQHPSGSLREYPNLKLICSMGAGVDHVISDRGLPEGVPIARIVDVGITFPMTNYVIMAVLSFHRQIFRYIDYKKNKIWDMSEPELDVSIGVLGAGELGGDVLDKLRFMGFPVFAYGKRPKSSYRHPYYFGDQLEEFLSRINVLVCMLPLTQQTEGFLNLEFFKKCKKGTYLINVARGRHLIEQDLITALDEGLLSGAFLDVYQKEPLPEDHPFWIHDKIMLTPHIASITNPKAAAPQIVENYQNLINNKPLHNIIDIGKGY